MMWKRPPTTGLQQLPEERKALAERYTIDADEAQRREQTAAAEAARRAAEEEAARQAAVIAAGDPQQERLVLASLPDPPVSTRPTGETPGPEIASGAPETAVDDEPPTENAELPIYRWFGTP